MCRQRKSQVLKAESHEAGAKGADLGHHARYRVTTLCNAECQCELLPPGLWMWHMASVSLTMRLGRRTRAVGRTQRGVCRR